jgi:hypothetical protein
MEHRYADFRSENIRVTVVDTKKREKKNLTVIHMIINLCQQVLYFDGC